jgi:hypothetical protein
MSKNGVTRHIKSRLDIETSYDEKQVLFWSLAAIIDSRTEENQPPSCSIHILMSRLCLSLGLLSLSLIEARRAHHSDPYNLETDLLFDLLKEQIPKFLLSEEVKSLKLEDLKKVEIEFGNSFVANEFFYQSLASAYALLGDYQSSQLLMSKASLVDTLKEAA